MENYQFEGRDILSQSAQSTFEYQNELLQQFQFVQNETLLFINIEESDQEVDITKQKLVKTQLFCRRASIQESQGSSSQQNQIHTNQPIIIQPEQQIQENKQINVKQIKRLTKRSQTAFKKDFGSFAKQNGSKIFLKRANQAIVNNFEKQENKNQLLPIISTNLENHIFELFKLILFIEKEMTAIEFIVLALKEYTLERKFDQNLFEFKNYTLAYQLETLEDQFEIDEDRFRRPIQRAKVLFKMKKILLLLEEPAAMKAISFQVEHSYSDYEDKTITIDYPVVLSCKQVDIVVNQTCQLTFGIDLQTLKQTYELFPEYIILLIEDAQTQSKLQMKCLNNSRIENVFDSFNNGLKSQRSHKEYFLRLKYPCIHTGIGPLSLNTPVNQLPIHWLVLEKYRIEYQTPNLMDLGRKFSNFKQTNYYEDGFISCNQQDSQLKMESINYLSSLYSYQEFQLMQLKQRQQYQVLIGIDYFDIRIIYINHQNNTLFSHSSLLQYLTNYIVDMFKSKKKRKQLKQSQSNYAPQITNKLNSISLIKIQSVILNNYALFQNKAMIKILSQIKQLILELYQKLDQLVELRNNHLQVDENLK